jgi:hypothetical protein
MTKEYITKAHYPWLTDTSSEFDVEWQEMPEGFVSDVTDEEVEHIVEYLLAADVYLDDTDISE